MLSIVHGPTDQPLLDYTIGSALRLAVEKHEGQIAITSKHQNVRWTWQQLDRVTDSLASGLLRRGIRKGDRVGIWSPNCAEWTTTQFATAKIGAILVNINPAYRPMEVEYAINKVACRGLITATRFKSSNYVDMLSALGQSRLPTLEWIAEIEGERNCANLRYEDLLDDVDPIQLQRIAGELDPHDPINIQFTSGTTGAPKGATLTHHNILNNGYFVGNALGLTSKDRICVPVPLYHCFGMVLGNLAAMTHGAMVVYPSESFDAEATLQAIEDDRCTALYGVPTMFIALLSTADFDSYDLSSLRTGIMAGAPCPIATMREVMGRMHMRDITIAYGMTETSPVSFQTSVDDTLEDKTETVGTVHPHVSVKIVDDDGTVVPRNCQGEIWTSGYSVMQGYWADEARTRESIDGEGWMKTGDLGVMDDRGYARITGRKKDMIIRGGENVYPREIEEYLMTHPD
ncbi:MAG: AMP-binding protein, partial [Pseudomonas fluorescens]